MSHSKIQTTSPIRRQRKLTSLSKPVYNFHPKPVYLGQKLIYVDFSSIQDTDRHEKSENMNNSPNMHRNKLLTLLVLTVTFIYVQYSPISLSESEINTHVMSSLIQLGNDPELSTSIVEILNYTLL